MTVHEQIDPTAAAPSASAPSASAPSSAERPRGPRDIREAAFVDMLISGEDAPGTDLVIKGAKLFLLASAAFVVVAAIVATLLG